jgi:hypothetical protein
MKRTIVVAVVAGLLGGGAGGALVTLRGHPARVPAAWFCHVVDDREITTCTRNVEQCAEKFANVPCVQAPLAWCGTNNCALSESRCQANNAGACTLTKP